MERIAVATIPIVAGREEDGRWWAVVEIMPGVMSYGATRDSAIAAVRALALRVAADCIDHGEQVPEPLVKVFSVASAAGNPSARPARRITNRNRESKRCAAAHSSSSRSQGPKKGRAS